MADPELQFDRAQYASPQQTAACASCKGPLGEEYWQLGQHSICAHCRPSVAGQLDQTRSGAFGRAALLGAGTALGCGIAYAAFASLPRGGPYALVTFGIAILVARVLRKASGGLGGLRYQILAVALTYVASTMGYAPSVLHAVPHESLAGYLWSFALMLAMPFMLLKESPMEVLVLGFCLWTAWQRMRGVPLQLLGPFRTGAPAPEAPAA